VTRPQPALAQISVDDLQSGDFIGIVRGARLDHLVGLGVEFTCASGAAAWVGTPFHDHARVSFAVKLGTPKAKIKSVTNERGTKS
jgi:hypothetical protein